MIKAGMRPIHPGEILREARYFGGDAQSWLNLQAAYDLRTAEQGCGAEINREVSPRAA